MSSQKILLILLIFGILLAIGGILYLDKVQNKTKTPFSFHTLLSSSPFGQASSPTPTGGVIMSMYRIGTDTIRITNDGFSPNSVTVAPGSRVNGKTRVSAINNSPSHSFSRTRSANPRLRRLIQIDRVLDVLNRPLLELGRGPRAPKPYKPP